MFALVIAKFFTFFAAVPCNRHLFFFIPPWWEYLPADKFAADCSIQAFSFPNDLLAVSLAVVDMLLRVAGLVAVVSVIAAGVGYITASGTVEKAASARRRIYNSLIGLGIVAVASGFVAFIGNTVK